MNKYIPRREVLKTLQIHYQTLDNMRRRKEIESIRVGNKFMYNLEKFMEDQGVNTKKEKINICYCRVSSRKQKGDLARQIKFMKKKYPNHEIIKDIGSGLNFKRIGLKKILKLAINGEINELVISYKDRLARFGFDLIEWILNTYSDSKIIIVNRSEEITPKEELTKDLVSIINVFVAKVNGLRKYKTKLKQEIQKNE
jgi:putative resolvase